MPAVALACMVVMRKGCFLRLRRWAIVPFELNMMGRTGAMMATAAGAAALEAMGLVPLADLVDAVGAAIAYPAATGFLSAAVGLLAGRACSRLRQ